MYVCMSMYVYSNIHTYTYYILKFQLLLSHSVVFSTTHFFSFVSHVSERVRAAHRCFERAGMYGDPGSHDYFDNLYRFAVSMSTRYIRHALLTATRMHTHARTHTHTHAYTHTHTHNTHTHTHTHTQHTTHTHTHTHTHTPVF
jgi:hypothetical protein